MRERRIGVNLLVLTDRPPGGTGHHAISLFEALVAAERAGKTQARFIGFAEEAAARHFSPLARSHLVLLPPGKGWRRAVNELLCLPLAARRRGVEWVINPAFFGAPWGTPRRALIIHDLYFRSVPHLVPARRRRLLQAIVPLLAHRSEAIFTVSQATKTELERFYPHLGARAQVLHSGNRVLRQPDNALLPVPPVGRAYLLMVGHLTANKRPETVITALAALRREGRDLALVHVGDDGGRLAPLAEQAGIAEHVTTLGHQPDSELAACYAHCEALVLPSIREGFGLPLIEAQAQGAPVIASSCAALVEVGGDTALYFPVEDAAQCAEAIRTVLNDPQQRRLLVERGAANAARFRWDETARRLIEALGL
jgi:glycosyltransferase involved in cell wall biosynthesis